MKRQGATDARVIDTRTNGRIPTSGCVQQTPAETDKWSVLF